MNQTGERGMEEDFEIPVEADAADWIDEWQGDDLED